MKCRVVLSAFLICLFALVLFPGRLAAQRSCESLTTLALTNATVMSAV